MSVEKFFWVISRINQFNSLTIFKDRWSRITKQEWYDKFSLEDKLELHKIKENKKQELIDRKEAEKNKLDIQIEELKETKIGKTILENPKAYKAWIEVLHEQDIRERIRIATKYNEYLESHKEEIIFENIKIATEKGFADNKYFKPEPTVWMDVPERTTKLTDLELTERRKNIKKLFRLKGAELEASV